MPLGMNFSQMRFQVFLSGQNYLCDLLGYNNMWFLSEQFWISHFKVEDGHEEEGSRFLRNIGNHLQNDTAPEQYRLQSELGPIHPSPTITAGLLRISHNFIIAYSNFHWLFFQTASSLSFCMNSPPILAIYPAHYGPLYFFTLTIGSTRWRI